MNVVPGYIRYVASGQLVTTAKAARLQVKVLRRVGHFVPAGIPLLAVNRSDRLSGRVATALLAAFDIGPTRTLQQDVEFGVLQIVDIALKAISPAVNDPSTAITCIDQLSRILINWIAHDAPDVVLSDPPHVVRVIMPSIDLDSLLDTAFEQIRHYSVADLAVSARLLRALDDIASSTDDPSMHARLTARAYRIYEGCRCRMEETDVEMLHRRLTLLLDRTRTDEPSLHETRVC